MSETLQRPNGIDHDLWSRLAAHARDRLKTAEPAHDFFHVERVVANAIAIARGEKADEAIPATAALLHELFNLPKSHPESAKAGDYCAEHARELLLKEQAPADMIAPITEAIRDHAFSKGVVPTSLTTKILQDADRLDALGAIGLARMWATCADMKRPFYSPDDPFCTSRAPDDKLWGLDHVYKKLLVVSEKLHLPTSRLIAGERTKFIRAFLEQLGKEITPDQAPRKAEELPPEVFRRIVDEAPDGIVVSRNGIVLHANAAAARLLGYPNATAFVGVSMASFLDPESQMTMRRRIEQARQNEGAALVPREYPATRIDGTKITAEIASSIVMYEGQPSVLAFARDVTERSRLRAQLAHSDRLSAMGVIAAGVAHEINNPLGFMRLATEVFERKLKAVEAANAPELIALAQDMRDGVDRISAIVRDLRVFGRYEDETTGPVDPNLAIDAAIRLVAHEVDPRARLTKEFQDLPLVVGVGARLEQVFVNLVLNAALAFPESSGSPGVIVIRATTNEENVTIDVVDNGPGMSPEVLGQIFEPFFTRPAASSGGSGRGSGLGLSISRGIVERTGGSISAKSELGKGTTMTVVLPRAQGAAMPMAAARPSRPVRAPSRRLKVLVVDDEQRIVDLVQSLLDGEHDVTGETDAVQALDRMVTKGATFDVVLCDLMMPSLSGMDLHERVAEKRPDLAPRFVFITGGAYTDRGRGVMSSVTTRLMKPFSAADLRTALADATD